MSAVAVTLAWPLLPVVAVELLSAAEAPEPGAAKVTVTPGTGLPYLSVTTATSGLAKPAPTAADWPEPEDTVTDVGVLGLLVRLKLAGVAPATEAVTM